MKKNRYTVQNKPDDTGARWIPTEEEIAAAAEIEKAIGLQKMRDSRPSVSCHAKPEGEGSIQQLYSHRIGTKGVMIWHT